MTVLKNVSSRFRLQSLPPLLCICQFMCIKNLSKVLSPRLRNRDRIRYVIGLLCELNMKAPYMSTVTDATAPVVLAVIIVVIDMQ